MNKQLPRARIGFSLLVAAAACFLPLYASQSTTGTPKIKSVRIDSRDVLVTVSVPSGVKKVTLESRARFGAGTWVPRSVSRLETDGGEVTFRLPTSAQAEILRVRADATETLPAAFYSGTNQFVSGLGSAVTSNGTGPTANDAAPGAGTGGAGAATTPRTVTESDIWKVEEKTLYFFNQYRGLQVVDLSAPDAPVITGTYPLPAAGEQMYVLNGQYVVLLAQDNCSTANGGSSQVLVLDTAGGVPKLVASLPVSGWIQESRLVGSALYVASQAYRPLEGDKAGAWEWGSEISSFDLSTPANPVVKDSLWYSGYGNVISATDELLFVALQDPKNWSQSILYYIDISSPDGAMKALGSIPTAGRIPDKFKINQSGDVLAVISENWNTGGVGVVTTLETFSLSNPAAPAKLGRLEFPQRESLHATRFDGDKVYIVTFYQVDPLWIVDLSDPTMPHIAGELKVPGWSTYIEPLGDRLVSIGINDTNDWRVAVSLFDVHDPTAPALLSKVPLGVNYSWSEASNDEKAFSVLPDAGLILVPYQGYETNGYASRVQLIDLSANSLKARGTIEHSFQPRRATLENNRIYSISGKELLTVDAADRDQPQLRSDLELSWNVDRVFVVGDYVLEVANGDNWIGWWSQSSATPPSIRVARSTDPEHPLSRLDLTVDLPILGAALQDGKLYLAQGNSSGGPIYFDAGANGTSDPQTNAPTLYLSVVDLGALPQLTVSGQTSAVLDPLGWSASLNALWPRPRLLVWSGGGGGFYPLAEGGVGGGVASGVVGGVSSPIGIWRPWWGGMGGRLFAFDVTAPSNPTFVSEVNLTTNAWWSFSSAFTAGGLVYVGHQASEFLEGVVVPGQTAPTPTVTTDKDTGAVVTNIPPVGTWVQRYYLDVVDYGDPKSPTLRPPVNIPGQLNGLAHGGALLYTVAPHWTNWVTDWSEWLDASAYDGVSAALVASLPLPKDWPHPQAFTDPNVFIARPNSASNSGQIEAWTLNDAGQFVQTGTFPTGSIANTLALFGNLLVAQMNNSSVLLLDASQPQALSAKGKGQPLECRWYDLQHAFGSLEQGLWLPLSDYGLSDIPIAP